MSLTISGTTKVSESEACNLADAFWSEISSLEGASSIASASFLSEASRLRRTGHENSLTNVLKAYGLQADVAISYKDVGLKNLHPVLSPADFVTCLSNERKLDILLMGHTPEQFRDFWKVYQQHNPDHNVFREHATRLNSCVPIYIHCDEGTSVKKRGLMVIQWQSLLGRGSANAPGTDVNYLSPSVKTRYLYACMMASTYGTRKNKPLLELTRHLALELRSIFYNGVDVELQPDNVVKLYLIPLGIKGDWSGLAKIGCLSRSHARDAPTKPFGLGICHLCKGGMEHHPWHKVDFKSMLRARDGVEDPWKHPPPVVEHIPMVRSQAASFFKPDLFHTAHKGVVADACANAIVPWFC